MPRYLLLIILAFLIGVIIVLAATPASDAHLVTKPASRSLKNVLKSQTKNYAHARYVCRKGGGQHKRWACWATSSTIVPKTGQGWLRAELRETLNRLRRPLDPRQVAAWEWYNRSDTRCVVDHEGGWKSRSIDPPDVYAGRFQMDYSFERETAFGRKMYDRYGRAWNWPPAAQVLHAYEVWLYAGWSRWPTYARYCS